MNCPICNDTVNDNESLICIHCKGTYHYECINITKRYFTSNLNSLKCYWKCTNCDHTKRRKKISSTSACRQSRQTTNDESNLSADDHLTEERSGHEDTVLSNTSAPNSSSQLEPTYFSMDLSTLNLQIQKLNTEIISARQEIDHLKYENQHFKTILQQHDISICGLLNQNENLTGKKYESTVTNNYKKINTTSKNNEKNTSGSTMKNLQANKKEIENDTVTTNSDLNQGNIHKQLLILGDQQASGLASELINSKKGKWNNLYSISSIIKSDAKTSDILSSYQSLTQDFGKHDRIILSIGSNDTNPIQLLNHLSIKLNSLKNTNVYVLQVLKNPHLNIPLLNYHIKALILNHPNCKFIYYKDHNILNNNTIVKNFSKYINFEIDVQDYYEKFLNIKNNYKEKSYHLTKR